MRHDDTTPDPGDATQTYQAGDEPAERYPTPPRAWLRRAPIPAGQREVLVELWSYGPRWSPGDALPETGTVRVWPSKARLAADLNRPPGTIDKRIRWLSKRGWIHYDPGLGGWWLAVETPVRAWLDDGPGEVYAIEFSNGTVKVGRSVSAETRIDKHRTSAACFGLHIVRFAWCAVSQVVTAETAMIEAMSAVAARRSGSEWFDGGYGAARRMISAWEMDR